MSKRSDTWVDMADLLTSLTYSELSRFIASGRLPAVIDRVQGVVETRRPDFLTGSYVKLLKDGDLLLNSLQRLSRTVL